MNEVKPGDIIQLGKHRLMCGDATTPDDVAHLFEGSQFALCFTSPPYSDQREYKLGRFDWHTMMCGAFNQIIAHGEPDCHILVNLGLVHKNRQVDMYWLEWLMHCANTGWPLFGWYTWDKGSGMPGEWYGRLAPTHEFVFHFTHEMKTANKWVRTLDRKYVGAKRRVDGALERFTSTTKFGQTAKVPDSVIRINREEIRGVHTANHPAVFPAALPEFMMRTWSQPHDIVYDPFCGSGTSIIAAQNLQRRCYAMEIEPSYCELAIKRWHQHQGIAALKNGEVIAPLRLWEG